MDNCLIIGAACVDIMLEIDRLPIPGEDIQIKSEDTFVGGCAFNVANVLKECDIPFSLLVPVGTGKYANIIKETLTPDFEIILKDIDEDNGYCISLIENSGERTFIGLPGIETKFEKEWFNKINASDYKYVYISGYEIEGIGGDNIISFLEDNKHLQIFFAPGPRITYISIAKFEKLFQLNPIIHLNKDEALSYTNSDNIEIAAKFISDKSNSSVVITLGDKGVLLYENKDINIISTKKANIINTSGAGDAHMGGVITSIIQGSTLKNAMSFANDIAKCVVESKSTLFIKK